MRIKPRQNLNSIVKLSGSKSYTNRALMIAALCHGTSTLIDPLISDDTLHMITALRALGAGIKPIKGKVVITGVTLHPPLKPLFVGNSGTTARFLTALAGLVSGTTIITGDVHMQKRPLTDLLSALQQLGIRVESKTGCPPVIIEGGSFVGGTCKLSGTTSSQYLSAILMVAPYADTDVKIVVQGELTSKPFVDVTIDVMKKFGVKVQNNNYRTFVVKGSQHYTPRKYIIEPDMTAASYFFAAPALAGGKVTVDGINLQTKQGDIGFVQVLKRMGCQVTQGKTSITISKKKQLKAITLDMNKMPDVVQTLAAVSLFAQGTTHIQNIENLRVKETNRIESTATELRKLGAVVGTTKSSITIQPPQKIKTPTSIETYSDHRMAMSFALVGLAVPHISIKDPRCVNKTFPDFWKMLAKLK
ncbi:MAG TPA: 3-phosphoshikimate 1-carboxyvinyltransferase [Candidatus Nanoarchaeia archaeon]|nr:3-phosphoshikimate 1-carboxyvinyltransferase [Candidatus Nanoarchaeia archaeon]